MRSSIIIAILAVCILGGCSTPSDRAPVATPAIQKAAPTAPAATLCIMWPVDGPNVQTAGVYVDGKLHALLRRNRYARVPISSGRHEVKMSFVGILGVGMPSTKETFEFRESETHYIVFTYDYKMTAVVPIGTVPLIMGHTSKDLVEVSKEQATPILSRLVPGVLK